MLDVDRRVHVNSRLEQLLHILIAFGVTAALPVGMGQLVHQNQLRPALERPVQVELPEGNPAMLNLPDRDLFQSAEQRRRLGPGVGLDIACHHVDAPVFGLMGGLQHGVSLSGSGGIAEEDFQFSTGSARLLVPNGAQELIRILSWWLHLGSSHHGFP